MRGPSITLYQLELDHIRTGDSGRCAGRGTQKKLWTPGENRQKRQTASIYSKSCFKNKDDTQEKDYTWL